MRNRAWLGWMQQPARSIDQGEELLIPHPGCLIEFLYTDLLKLIRMFFSLVSFVFVAVRSKRSTIRVSRWRLRPTGWRGPCVVPLAAHLLFFCCMGCSLLALPSDPDVDVHVDGSVKREGTYILLQYTTRLLFLLLIVGGCSTWSAADFFLSLQVEILFHFSIFLFFSGCSIFYFCLGVFFV